MIQRIDGVVALHIEALYTVGARRDLAPILYPRPARWEQGDIHPAELLLINARNGIQLTAEQAT